MLSLQYFVYIINKIQMKRNSNNASGSEDDGVWDYCSLKRQRKVYSKNTMNESNSSQNSDNIAQKKTTQRSKVSTKDKVRQNETHDKYKVDKIPLIVSSSQKLSPATAKTVKLSTSQKKIGNKSKKTNVKKHIQETPVSNNKERLVHDGNCPFCQMPFSILIVQSPQWHVMECMDRPISTAEECPKGVNCDITIEGHFRGFRHTLLADLRAGVKSNSDKNVSQPVEGGESVDKDTPIDQAKRKLTFSVLKPMEDANMVADMDDSEEVQGKEQEETPVDVAKKKLTFSENKTNVTSEQNIPVQNMCSCGNVIYPSDNDIDQAKRKLSFSSLQKRCNQSVSNDNEECSICKDKREVDSQFDSPFLDLQPVDIDTPKVVTRHLCQNTNDETCKVVKPMKIEIMSVSSLTHNTSQSSDNGYQSDQDIFQNSDNPHNAELIKEDIELLLDPFDIPEVETKENLKVVKDETFCHSSQKSSAKRKSQLFACDPGSASKSSTQPTPRKKSKGKSPAQDKSVVNINKQPSIYSFFKQKSVNSATMTESKPRNNISVTNTDNVISYTFTAKKLGQKEDGEVPQMPAAQPSSSSSPDSMSLVSTTVSSLTQGACNILSSTAQKAKSAFSMMKQPTDKPWALRSERTSKAGMKGQGPSGSVKSNKNKGKVLTEEANEVGQKDSYKMNNKRCPFYKKMPGTPFTVDAFRYGSIDGCLGYFLTHFHYDHYGGLRKSFQHPIYCSKVTGNLVEKKIRVDRQYIRTIELYTPTVIEEVEVTLLEANHCPGSVLILFKLRDGRVFLHTGDFRATDEMTQYPQLKGLTVDQLYLDTTYCDPSYAFPPQRDVIAFAVNLATDFVYKNPNALIVAGSYTIGKERIFLAIAEALNCKICVTREKKGILDCLEDANIESRLTLKMIEARVHVLPMKQLRYEELSNYVGALKPRFDRVLAFEPTGWTHSNKVPSLENIKPKVQRGCVTLYGVPYSEHSSYTEMKHFTQALRPKKVIPTVNNGSPSSRKKMEELFASWMKEAEESPKKQLKQRAINGWLLK